MIHAGVLFHLSESKTSFTCSLCLFYIRIRACGHEQEAISVCVCVRDAKLKAKHQPELVCHRLFEHVVSVTDDERNEGQRSRCDDATEDTPTDSAESAERPPTGLRSAESTWSGNSFTGSEEANT